MIMFERWRCVIFGSGIYSLSDFNHYLKIKDAKIQKLIKSMSNYNL